MQHQANFQAAQAYRQAAVAVPPLRAVVMMIDGAITALQKSVTASEEKKFEESHDLMIRATAILRGLSHNLNFDRGGEVAEGLHTTLSYADHGLPAVVRAAERGAVLWPDHCEPDRAS